jgi:protein NrfD
MGDGMNEIDVARHSRFIDPQLHVWGWEIPVYLFLGGMAAGVMILTSALWARREDRSPALRWLAFAAPVLVSVGMGALFLDLAHKLHAWRFYLAFRWTSPMSWGAWILVLVYPVSLLAALANLDAAQAERAIAFAGRLGLGKVARSARGFGVARAACLRRASIVTGVALGVYTGVLLSTLGARALWGSALLGPLFLVSGVSTGAALLLLFRVSEEERHLLARWDRVAMALELAVLVLFLAGLATSDAAGKAAADLLLGGAFTAPFWTLVVIAGLAVPSLLAALEARLRLRMTAAAPALVLAGGLALRWILVAAGQV